jgi:predicted AlkP superfamily pyrophosphatase or phosphodiesterase
MKRYLLLIACFVSSVAALAQVDTTQKVVPGRVNSPEQQQKPYVILISVDGFRHDYAEKYNTANLNRLAAQGVKAESMIPAFPSKTFPNHYTIVTGLYPAHHGLINNSFYDPKRKESYRMSDRSKVEDGSWYGGVPLWVLAEQQQMLTASFYWVGSEAPVMGVRPTYYYHYNEQIPMDRRIKTVVDWLNLPEEQRPHLITFYMPEVDHAGHRYGPDAPETEKAVREFDEQLQKLAEAVATTGLPVNFVLLSDHGMTKIDQEVTLPLPVAVDTAQFLVSGGGMVVELHAKNKKHINATYRKLRKEAGGYAVYRKKDMPRHLQYGNKNDVYGRIGDILLLSDWPKVFHFSSRKPSPGTHGYDPYQVKDMHTIFFAWGPAFKKALTIPAFENVNVYPLITEVLGLKYKHKIDGDRQLAEQVL